MPRQPDDAVRVNWTVHSWERGYQHAPDPDVIVWIDIDQFDRLWWMSDQYIVTPSDPADNQPAKYAKVGQRFLAGEPVWMPEVGRDAVGALTFRDGRHRYLWMRENGAHAMPVAVEKSEAKVLRYVPPHLMVLPASSEGSEGCRFRRARPRCSWARRGSSILTYCQDRQLCQRGVRRS